MGRLKREKPKEVIAFRVEQDVSRKIEVLALTMGVTKSRMIETLITLAINSLESEEDNETV